MLFTRTIRRKMVFGLSLVLVMLVTLSLSGISGLVSYRQTVRGLEQIINHVPRRADLTAAVALLNEPLLQNTPQSRRQAFQRQLDDTRAKILDFRRKLDLLPPEPGVRARRQVTEPLLARVAVRLERLDRMQQGLDDEQTASATTDLMLCE